MRPLVVLLAIHCTGRGARLRDDRAARPGGADLGARAIPDVERVDDEDLGAGDEVLHAALLALARVVTGAAAARPALGAVADGGDAGAGEGGGVCVPAVPCDLGIRAMD